MTAFAKPWETKGSDPLVTEAVIDAAQKPWDPKPAKVEPRIAEQHKERAVRQGEGTAMDWFKAQAFAKEYLIDFDHRAAVIRMGVAGDDDDGQEAARIGRKYLNNPLCLQAIQAYMGQIEASKVVTRERVLMGLLKEACYHGLGASHSARVAAWGKLAKVLGMELPPEDPNKTAAQGGVMLVPMAGGIEAWEAAAIGQQKQLKSDVRD